MLAFVVFALLVVAMGVAALSIMLRREDDTAEETVVERGDALIGVDRDLYDVEKARDAESTRTFIANAVYGINPRATLMFRDDVAYVSDDRSDRTHDDAESDAEEDEDIEFKYVGIVPRTVSVGRFTMRMVPVVEQAEDGHFYETVEARTRVIKDDVEEEGLKQQSEENAQAWRARVHTT